MRFIKNFLCVFCRKKITFCLFIVKTGKCMPADEALPFRLDNRSVPVIYFKFPLTLLYNSPHNVSYFHHQPISFPSSFPFTFFSHMHHISAHFPSLRLPPVLYFSLLPTHFFGRLLLSKPSPVLSPPLPISHLSSLFSLYLSGSLLIVVPSNQTRFELSIPL